MSDQVDIRTSVSFESICKLLLKVAKNPLNYIDNDEIKPSLGDFKSIGTAAELARQASASVICNCVAQLWSVSVAHLHAVEPIFPLYPSNVIKFVEETRLPFQSYTRLYYNICKKPFDGTATAQKLNLLIEMRNALQHDKPESSSDYHRYRVEKVIKWRKQLEPFIGKEALLWLPRCRPDGHVANFTLGGEPPIMKMMKYPVAKWAYDSSVEISKEMHDMLFAQKGGVKIVSEKPLDELIDPRFSDRGSNLLRLWAAGE